MTVENLLDGLGAWEYREANRRICMFGQTERVNEVELITLLDRVPALPSQYPAAFNVELKHETITWYNYESLIWSLGESVRQILKRQRSLRRSTRLWELIEAICLDRRYGKGRESFTMLLGQYGGPMRVPVLVQLLDDPDVHGHALYALRLLRAPNGIEHAERLLTSPRTWIRGEARKYLANVRPDNPTDVDTVAQLQVGR